MDKFKKRTVLVLRAGLSEKATQNGCSIRVR